MQKMDGFKTAVVLEMEQVKKLDEIAARFKLTRSEALRRIVDTGLDAYRTYENLGIVSLAEITIRAREALARSRQPKLI